MTGPDDVPVGPDLASVLAAVETDQITDAGLVDLVAAAVRLQGWAHAAAARFAATLADRDSMHPTWSEAAGGAPAPPDVTGDELAMRLAWSRRSATRLVRHGRAFRHVLSDTGDALADGRIGMIAAQIIADRLVDLPAQTALEVQDRVLEGATRRTPTQLRRDLERALIAVDAEEAARRHGHARSGRRVDRPRVLPDGMAGMWAVLPAPDATRIDATLDAAARTARSAGDPRTLDQLRADGLRDLVLHTACTSTAGPREVAPSRAASTSHDAGRGARSDTMARSTDADPPPAGLSPAGPSSADLSSVGRPSGANPGEPSASPADLSSAGRPSGANPGEPFASSARTATRPRTEPPGAGIAQRGRCAGDGMRAHVRVTVALSTLLGVDDEPADLAGYGPIDAVAARALAEGGVWQRVVTDPLSGTVLDVGRTRYRPPAGLVQHVQVRDGTCARPGCSADAEGCDIDHTIEFHATPRKVTGPPGGRGPATNPVGAPGVRSDDRAGAGTTAAHNLGPLCRRDHRLKTDGGFQLRQTAPGEYEWVSPTGHRYRVVPGDNGRHLHLGSGPPDPGPPPF